MCSLVDGIISMDTEKVKSSFSRNEIAIYFQNKMFVNSTYRPRNKNFECEAIVPNLATCMLLLELCVRYRMGVCRRCFRGILLRPRQAFAVVGSKS